jgi:hypothetical protein
MLTLGAGARADCGYCAPMPGVGVYGGNAATGTGVKTWSLAVVMVAQGVLTQPAGNGRPKSA